jgi:hypothetical protein
MWLTSQPVHIVHRDRKVGSTSRHAPVIMAANHEQQNVVVFYTFFTKLQRMVEEA